MTRILQYAPWCKLFIITDRPYDREHRLSQLPKKVDDFLNRLNASLDGKSGTVEIDTKKLADLFDPGMKRQLYDVSKDIITGSVNLRINQMSTLQVTLANPNGKYLNVFMPNDMIILFLKRIEPIQVFTGYIDEVPIMTGRGKEAISITASCTLKKLNNVFWNPRLNYWIALQNQRINEYATPEEILHWLVEDIGGFDPSDVYIQPFKDVEFWKQLLQYTSGGLFGNNFSNMFGYSSTGSNLVSDPSELRNPNLIDPIKLRDYLLKIKSPMAVAVFHYYMAGRVYNINPALIVAMAGQETSFGKNPKACNNNGANFNYWGIKYPGDKSEATRAFRITRSARRSPEGDYYASYPNDQMAAMHIAYILSKSYLDKNGSYYVDGTIRGISGVWTWGKKGAVNTTWANNVEKYYSDIMQACRIGESTVKPKINASGYVVNPARDGGVFPIPSNYQYRYRNDWGEPRGGGTRRHKGNDIFAKMGTPAVAVYSGKVIFKPYPSYGHNAGNTILLYPDYDPSGKTYFAYMHMQGFAPNLKSGDKVQVGQVIGYVGDTGNAKGGEPHIHFEFHPGGGPAVNPYEFLVSHDPAKTGGAGSVTVDQEAILRGLNPIITLNQLPSAQDVSFALGGVYQLMVSERLLSHILEVANYGMYIVMSDGRGRFIAKWADFFGEEKDAEGKTGPHFRIEDIEIIDFRVNVNDINLVTHQFVIPDSAWDGTINEDDWFSVSSSAFVTNSGIPASALDTTTKINELIIPFLGRIVREATEDTLKGKMTAEEFNQLNQLNNLPLGVACASIISDRIGIFKDSEWRPEEFIEKYGYRPAIDESLICSNVAQAQFLAEYKLREKWANLVRGSINTTFLPEVRPGMIVEIPSKKMQFFVESVSHTFGVSFGSSMNLIAGVFLDAEKGKKNPFISKTKNIYEAISLDSHPVGKVGSLFGLERLIPWVGSTKEEK